MNQRSDARLSRPRRRLAAGVPSAAAALAVALSAPAQEVGPPTLAEVVPETQKIVWPRDADRPVFSLDGEVHSVRDVLQYVNDRHAPKTMALLETASGRALFESPQFAQMVRQVADIHALRAEAEALGVTTEQVEAEVSAALKAGFEAHLEKYVERRQRSGNPVPLTQERINILLEHYQNANGLADEVQGFLNALVPETPLEADGVLREFYRNHPRFFGGRVSMSHILVRHRDARTGELLVGDDSNGVVEKVADVRSRLKADGSNFEEVARLLSEDRITAQEGGILREVRRFDPRLPAALCRAAWGLRDGEFTRVPVQSPYGLHFVKRIGYNHRYYVYFHEKLKPTIQQAKRKLEQENLLWKARQDHELKLLY